MEEMGFIWFFASLFAILITTHAFEEYSAIISGASFDARCKSSILPVWSWYGKTNNIAKTLATGTVVHGRFKNER